MGLSSNVVKKYLSNSDPNSPLEINGVDAGKKFRELVQLSNANDDALFLGEWLALDGTPKMLASKNPNNLEDWRYLVREMTGRIDNRRAVIRRRLR